MVKPKRVGIYVHISKDRKGQELGIQRQEKACRELCERLGWSVLKVLRIEKVTGISEDDREFLRKRGRELRDRLAELSFESSKGPVHGDAHVQNLMVDRSGQVLLIDFEGFSFDRPESGT
jgi:thiamine kinase-like enzyme